MTLRLVPLAVALGAAATLFATPASAIPDCTHQSVSECLKPYLAAIKIPCIPTGDLESPC